MLLAFSQMISYTNVERNLLLSRKVGCGLKTKSIHQYILHYQRTQFIITVTLIFLLTAFVLLFSVRNHAESKAKENGQFIKNYISSFFEDYDSRSLYYNQDQNIRNLLRYAADNSEHQTSQQLASEIKLPSDVSLYSAGNLVYPQIDSAPNFSVDVLSDTRNNILLVQEDELYYFCPYFNFTQTKALGLLCYRIPYANFQKYVEKTIPSDLVFSLFDSTGNLFYSNTSPSKSLSKISIDSSELYSCNVYYNLQNEYSFVAFLLLLLLIVCSFSLIIGIAYCSRIAYKISAPINRLVASIENNQSGELMTAGSLPSSQLDEIDRLATAYEDLLLRIQNLITQNHKENVLRMESQLSVLQERINPHFLFNTLELISSQAILEDADKTAVLTQKLGALFRYSLRVPDIITLKQELQYTYDYLYLQNVRFNELITSEFDVDTIPPDFLIPKLTLQPILENCFKHGFDSTSDEPHTIRICADIKEDTLIIKIIDDGCGISIEDAQRINANLLADKQNFAHFVRRGEHIGLRNVNVRLCLRFQIDQALFIAPANPIGTEITVRLPLQASDKEKETDSICTKC